MSSLPFESSSGTDIVQQVWALLYTATSVAFSLLLKKLFKLPGWLVPATAFNNTTSMPLLLIQTLATTGILDSLVTVPGDTVAAAVRRAQSYFLANALCGNVAVFTIGPKIMDATDQYSEVEEGDNAHRHEQANNRYNTIADANAHPPDEQTSLLPRPILQQGTFAKHKIQAIGHDKFQRLPASVRSTMAFLASLVNPPLIGGIIGITLGLVPALHRAFFNNSSNGGIFNAWLVTSIANIGDLFAALQVVIVGVRLSQCLRRMVRGEDSGQISLRGALISLIVRYFIWPL